MSAAGDRVAVASARGQSLLAPAFPAVSGREDLTCLRHANNLLRVARMHGDAHHRRLGLDPAVEALPSFADVVAAEDPAVGAAEGRAQSGIKHLRIMRRDPQIAAIGQRREPADLDVAPMRPAIVTAEETHAVGEKHRARCGRAAGESMAVQHASISV